MNNKVPHRSLAAVLLAVAWVALVDARGASGFEQAVFTVGAVRHDSSGKAWAYVTWHGGDDLPPSGPGARVGAYAVYSKSGDPTVAEDFKLLGLARRQADLLALNLLLSRAAQLGDDPVQIAQTLAAFFPGAATAVSPAEKLASVVASANADPEQNEHLLLLARRFPSVAMAAGMGWATPLETLSTIEIRAYDMAAKADLAVVGRVTLDPAHPPVLPPPAPPVVVGDSSAGGHLNVRLRWGLPPDLARFSLACQGFAVFRVDRDLAVQRGYHISPPPAAQMLVEIASEPARARRLSDHPLLASAAMTPEQAADPQYEPGEFFVIDDNGRFEGGAAFAAGSEYYYFAVALDPLGQPGALSHGTLVKVCDTIPPSPPAGVQVENDYHFPIGGAEGQQRLRVSWLQPANPAQPVRYHIYRAASPEVLQQGGDSVASNRIAGPIDMQVGSNRMGFLDDGAGAPDATKDAGASFWYAVRVEEQGACGAKFSPLSAPVFGVLRQRAGPAAPEGSIQIRCVQPVVSWTSALDENYLPGGRDGDPPPPTPGAHRYHVVCETAGIRATWADFFLETQLPRTNLLVPDPGRLSGSMPVPNPEIPDPVLDSLNPTRTLFLGRYDLADAENSKVELDVRLLAEAVPELNSVRFACRVGTADGSQSVSAATSLLRVPTDETIRWVRFTAAGEAMMVAMRPLTGEPPSAAFCQVHHPLLADGVAGIELQIALKPGAREYRLYRCVDGGPMTLIKQDTAEFDSANPDLKLTLTDPDLPARGGNLCYHVQLLDQNGNASPMVYLGQVPVLSILTPPVPEMLAPEKTVAGHRIKWFCPPAGVERFEVWISVEPGSLGVQPLSPLLSKDLAPNPNLRVMDDAASVLRDVRVFRTVPASKLGPGPLYQLDLLTEIGRTYRVKVLAVGAHGDLGPASKAARLKGEYVMLNPPQQAKVPWPARVLPPVRPANPAMVAMRLPDAIHSGLAIRVGAFQLPLSQIMNANRNAAMDFLNPPYAIGAVPLAMPLSKRIYTDVDGSQLFPGVLYRQQIPNGVVAAPRRIVQVSPLVEDFRLLEGSVPSTGFPILILADPMFRMVVQSISGPGEDAVADVGIFLLDHQPGRVFARYAYQWLCQDPFHREISRTVTMPSADMLPILTPGGGNPQ